MHRNTLKVCFGLCLLLMSVYAANIRPPISEVLASEPFPPNRPVLFTDPDIIERDVGVEFTVSVKIFNLTNNIWTDPDTMKQYPLGNLYGVGMNFTWDPAVLEHVNHLVKIPVDDYPDGVLWAPTTMWKDEVSDASGYFRMDYTSLGPNAPAFNNPDQNNTVFEITLKAKKRGSCLLRLTQVALSGQYPGDRVYHEGYVVGEGSWGRGAIFTTPGAPVAKFSVWPTDLYAGVNKPVMFNASESYDTDGTITNYMWTFGDGSTGSTADRIIYHTYTSIGSFKATLRVQDNDGLESLLFEKTVKVVEKRDVTIRDIDVQPLIRYGSVAEINVTVSTPRDVFESFIVSAFYNSTDTDGWVLIGTRNVANLAGDAIVVLSWNTGDIALPPGITSRSYHILANATYVPHEANTADNSITSSLIEVTAEEIHDVTATISKVGVEAGGQSFSSPFIRGENVTVRFTVKSSGTADETYDITLRFVARNGTELLPPREWIGEFLEYANQKPYRFSTVDLPATYCNITLKVDVTGVDRHPEDNYGSVEVRVVKPPTIQIQYPENIHKNESVTFDATASLHQDPDGQITTYTWDVVVPGGSVYGSVKEGSKVGYTFNVTGSTRVRLRITDNFGLSYDASIRDLRPAIDAYMRELTINIQESSGGGWQLPIDPLYIVIGIVIVVIVAVVAFKIIRKPKSSA